MSVTTAIFVPSSPLPVNVKKQKTKQNMAVHWGAQILNKEVLLLYWPIQPTKRPFVILSERSCERSQLPLLGQFLSRRWFMLCITMKIEPRIAKQYKCHYCCVCKNYREKTMKDGKKSVFCIISWLTRRLGVWTKFCGGHPVAWTASSCLLPDARWLGGVSCSLNSKFLLVARCTLTMSLQQCLLSWHCDLCEFIVTAFHCKNSMQVRSKNSPGT